MSNYIEDIFKDFYLAKLSHDNDWHSVDATASDSFYNLIVNDKPFTKKQANYLIKILQKYHSDSKNLGLDYSEALKNPIWKKEFREIDFAKKCFVELDESGYMYVCFKFPYKLIKEFEEEISCSIWDADRQLRSVYVYHINPVKTQEFLIKHQFEIDESFYEILSSWEEIWSNQEEILFGCSIENEQVELINPSGSALEYWSEKSNKILSNDLLLAKHMGYRLIDTPKNTVEIICSSEAKDFWIQDIDVFFDIFRNVQGHAAVLVDRVEDLTWLKEFVSAARKNQMKDLIRICFRSDDKESDINRWIKEEDLGGKVNQGRIFIFKSQPPKWLFNGDYDVRIILANSLYPTPSIKTQAWMQTHPLVFYHGEIKATKLGKQEIVKL